jgi:hypothetical protein
LNSDAGTSATAKVYLVFLNKGLFKNDKKQQQSAKATTSLSKSGSKAIVTETPPEKDSGTRFATPTIDSGKKRPS